MTVFGLPGDGSGRADRASVPAILSEEVGERPRYDSPDEAYRYYLRKRSPDGRPIPFGRYRRAIERTEQMPVFSTASGKRVAKDRRSRTRAKKVKGKTTVTTRVLRQRPRSR